MDYIGLYHAERKCWYIIYNTSPLWWSRVKSLKPLTFSVYVALEIHSLNGNCGLSKEHILLALLQSASFHIFVSPVFWTYHPTIFVRDITTMISYTTPRLDNLDNHLWSLTYVAGVLNPQRIYKLVTQYPTNRNLDSFYASWTSM